MSSVREGGCFGEIWRSLGDGKTAEVMIELKGLMRKKRSKENSWNTPSHSFSGSEPEISGTDDEKLQEVSEKKVMVGKGCVLDQLVEGLAAMKGKKKEKK